MTVDLATLGLWLKQRVNDRDFREFLAQTLLGMCRIDTIPTRNITDTARREGQLLDLIEESIARYGLAGRMERHSISGNITAHPFYTFPHYAGTADAYSARSNLLYLRDAPAVSGSDSGMIGSRMIGNRTSSSGTACAGVAVNAHIDTVAPYFPPRREGERALGRGACDDKGGCTVMVGTLRLLRELERQFAVYPASDLTFMFVIDEEMGGNGSLSLAMDERLSERYDTAVVLECCDGQVHPGGRGALWYRVEVPVFHDEPPPSLAGYNPLLLALEIIRSMDREGAAIRAESAHPLFAQSAVQTSPGILGSYGEHPARICAFVAFELSAERAGSRLDQLETLLKRGLEEYIHQYGDKRVGEKSAAGRTGVETARLQRHYDLVPASEGTLELRVHGLSGHMGSLFENDNALIKAAYLLEALPFVLDSGGTGWGIHLLGKQPRSALVLEGGQGFVPTHSMDRIKARLSKAVQQAYRRYARLTWKRIPYFRDATPRVSFSKLHNEAFQSDPACPAVVDALQSAEEAGIDVRRPVLGWEVSSDARIFAHLRPGISVFTTGPGKLALAHSDQEQIKIDELCTGTLMLTLFLLRHGGFIRTEIGAGSPGS